MKLNHIEPGKEYVVIAKTEGDFFPGLDLDVGDFVYLDVASDGQFGYMGDFYVNLHRFEDSSISGLGWNKIFELTLLDMSSFCCCDSDRGKYAYYLGSKTDLDAVKAGVPIDDIFGW